jgi:Cys-tRNA(Pro) deacylase
MEKTEYPVTTAIRLLRDKKVEFRPHLYAYEENGGTGHSASALGVSEHEVVKTIVMATDEGMPLLVLMHGDREISTKQLARVLNVKRVEPCDESTATRHTGYIFGGTSPFGTRHPLPVYVERSIFDLPRMFINGGKRGFLVEINPADLKRVLPVVEVDVATSFTS